MTSGNFQTVFLDSITINREGRQRRELVKVDELAASIRESGLINPPVVTPELVLVAGERRLEACRSLGWTSIPVQFTTDLDPVMLHLIELEENVKRVDLTWQDQNDAITAYHNLRKEQNPEWTQNDTAQALSMAQASVARHLTVAEVRKEDYGNINKVEKLSEAVTIATRRNQRKTNEGLAALLPEPEGKSEDTADPSPTPLNWKIENLDFLAWSKRKQKKFNLIHCDFPYGISTGDKMGQSAASTHGQYADSPDIYFALLKNLITRQDNFIAPQAHLIFWLSMKFYCETKAALEGAGWTVESYPLVWHKSDNAGVLPDPQRGGRNTYETALFCHRGDQRIVKPVAKSFAAPTTKLYHTSEKSLTMLQHFLRMVVDDTTMMLDPTCGSGNAVRASLSLGARFSLGLELNPEFATTAEGNVAAENMA